MKANLPENTLLCTRQKTTLFKYSAPGSLKRICGKLESQLARKHTSSPNKAETEKAKLFKYSAPGSLKRICGKLESQLARKHTSSPNKAETEKTKLFKYSVPRSFCQPTPSFLEPVTHMTQLPPKLCQSPLIRKTSSLFFPWGERAMSPHSSLPPLNSTKRESQYQWRSPVGTSTVGISHYSDKPKALSLSFSLCVHVKTFCAQVSLPSTIDFNFYTQFLISRDQILNY